MSVLIKGIKIPKSCGVCIFDDYGHCIMTKRYSGGSATHGRASFCPLAELPESHGRLIDADALIRDHFSPEHRIALSEANKTWMRKIINDAPTIVEAEGEEGKE